MGSNTAGSSPAFSRVNRYPIDSPISARVGASIESSLDGSASGRKREPFVEWDEAVGHGHCEEGDDDGEPERHRGAVVGEYRWTETPLPVESGSAYRSSSRFAFSE